MRRRSGPWLGRRTVGQGRGPIDIGTTARGASARLTKRHRRRWRERSSDKIHLMKEFRLRAPRRLGRDRTFFFSRVFSSSGASGRSLRGTRRTRTARERRLAVDSSPREARWTRARRSRRPRRRFGTEGSADTASRRSESSSRGALLVRLTLGDDVERVRGGRRRGRGLARASGCPRAPGPTGRGPAPTHPRARASRVPDARSPESRPSRVASRVPGAGLR